MAVSFSIEVDDKGSPRIQNLNRNLNDANETSKKLSKGLKIAAGAIAAVGAAGVAGAASVFALTKRFAESQDNVGKFAEKIGFSVEGLSSLQFAAQMGGVSTDNFSIAMQRFTRRLAEARAGGGAAKGALEDLGKIMGKDLVNTGKTAESTIFDIADAFQKVDDPVKRTSLAFKLFDSGGVSLINVLKDGSAGLKEMTDRAKEIGATFDEEAAANSAKFNGALLELTSTINGAFREAANNVMPEITQVMEKLRDVVIENKDKFSDFGKNALLIFKKLAPLIEATGKQISLVFETISDNIARLEVNSNIRLNKTKANLLEAFKIQADLSARSLDGEQQLSKEERSRLANVNKFIEAQKKSGEFTQEQLKIFKIRGERALLNNILHEEANTLTKEENELIKNRLSDISKEIDSLNKKNNIKDKSKTIDKDELKRAADKLAKERKAASDKLKQIEIEKKWKEDGEKFLLGVKKKLQEDIDAIAADSFEKGNEREQKKIELKKSVEEQIRLENLGTHERQIALIKAEAAERALAVGNTAALKIATETKINEVVEQKRQENLQKIADNLSQAGDLVSTASGAAENIRQAAENRINNRFDERKEAIEEEFALRIKQAGGSAKAEEAIRKQRDDKLRQLDLKRESEIAASNRRSASLRKTLATGEAIINGAVAFTKALTAGPIMGPILAGFIAVQTATQVALIQTQKFREGGLPTGRNAVIQVNEAGQESVINAQGTSILGRQGVNALNEGRTDELLELISQTSGNRGGGGISISINGGMVDKNFVETQLIPMIEEANERF